jgi:hypothetical protein
MNEDDAKAIWLRAAELQAESAVRSEAATRQLAAADDPASDVDGISPDVVRAAALEAGIGSEFIELALAERDNGLTPPKKLTGWRDRSATHLLGTDERRIDVSRVIEAAPAEVLSVMQKILPNHPYLLTLRDTVGADPLNGAMLLFAVPKISAVNYTTFSYKMAWADLRELRFTLHPRADGAHTEVSIHVPLDHSRRVNWIASISLTSVSGVGGGLFGAAVAKAAALAGAAIAGPIAAGVVATGALGAWGMRGAYRTGLRKGREELVGILQTISVTCRLGTGFFPASPAPSKDQGDGLDLSGLL